MWEGYLKVIRGATGYVVKCFSCHLVTQLMIYERGVETCPPTLSRSLSLSVIQQAHTTESIFRNHLRNFLYLHLDFYSQRLHSGGPKGYFSLYLPVCAVETVKRNRV